MKTELKFPDNPFDFAHEIRQNNGGCSGKIIFREEVYSTSKGGASGVGREEFGVINTRGGGGTARISDSNDDFDN